MDNGRFIAEGSPRELIAAHIEPEVVEVYGEPGEMSAAAWAQAEAAQFATRVEVAGETAFCYLTESRPLLPRKPARPALPAPPGEPGGCFPEADGTRPARLK
ncbi:MAG: hypothetical protein M5R42_04720 [Rhodocyclaceae bacterium]|nr:hypothetical protein [Rhodocyclaceae bacterium]